MHMFNVHEIPKYNIFWTPFLRVQLKLDDKWITWRYCGSIILFLKFFFKILARRSMEYMPSIYAIIDWV